MIIQPNESKRRTGVLFVGLSGSTASTTVVGATAMRLGEVPEQYGTTELPPFFNLDLVEVDDLVFGGWDYQGKDVWSVAAQYGIIPRTLLSNQRLAEQVAKITPAPGLKTSLDIPLEASHDNVFNVKSLSEAVKYVQGYIETFRERNKAQCIVTVFLGSPHKKGSRELRSLSKEALQAIWESDRADELPSGLLYALGSVLAGAHFVDFTPSETLETPALNELAKEMGIQLAGRDGSTGQTLLKIVVAQMLKIRNLRLQSWFSTNLIGNHDGYVLNLPGYAYTKLHDKTHVLEPLLGYDDFEHLVTINYFRARGDRKEAWDVVDFTGWLGTEMSLRLNWNGEDSMLAAPLILDLIRLIEYGARYHLGGLQEQLALFFKYPLPTGQKGEGLAEQFDVAARFYKHLGKGSSEQRS